MNYFLWISILLFILSYIFRKNKKAFCVLAPLGWLFFSFHWFKMIPEYMFISDYTNIVLVSLAGIACLAVSFFILRHIKTKDDSEDMKTYHLLMKTIIIICIIYFPFNAIEPVGNRLIEAVTYLTYSALGILGYPAVLESWESISYNSAQVYIILGCTAIESIALFAGIVLSSEASGIKKTVLAIFFSGLIFVLNIIRNVFVIVAFGEMWFGENSFVISHHYIAKAGSGIALVILAYMLFRLMPEIFDYFERLYYLIKKEIIEVIRLN